MAKQDPRWVRILGDGLVYLGPGWLIDIVFGSDGQNHWLKIYDGQDVASGRLMFYLHEANDREKHLNVWPGYRFEVGLYVDANYKADATLLNFQPDVLERD